MHDHAPSPDRSAVTAAEFDSALRRAGLTVERERRSAMLESYERYLEMVGVLAEEQACEAEPSLVLDLARASGAAS